MPIANTPADTFCLALYTLAGGHMARGFLLATVADWLGISFRKAERMALAAAEAGLVNLEFGTITLTGEGQTRGATLTPPAVRTSARRPLSATRSSPRAKPRPRRPAERP